MTKGPNPSETRAMEILRRRYPGSTVELHDRNQGERLYDLDIFGPVRGAAEVGLVTSKSSQAAYAHFDRRLRGRRSQLLTRMWHLSFADMFDPDGENERQYPHQPAPAADQLEAILARLENRRIWDLQPWWEYCPLTENGWTWIDDDVRDLHALIGGRAADRAWSIGVPDGEDGGWTFDLVEGLVSGLDPNLIVDDVAERLATDADHLKAGASGLDVRLAVLVYDLKTSAGYSTSHWEPSDVPTQPLQLPPELTGVLVIGVNDNVVAFEADRGWFRF